MRDVETSDNHLPEDHYLHRGLRGGAARALAGAYEFFRVKGSHLRLADAFRRPLRSTLQQIGLSYVKFRQLLRIDVVDINVGDDPLVQKVTKRSIGKRPIRNVQTDRVDAMVLEKVLDPQKQ